MKQTIPVILHQEKSLNLMVSVYLGLNGKKICRQRRLITKRLGSDIPTKNLFLTTAHVCVCVLWGDLPMGNASWLNLLDEDAQLAAVLTFQAHHTEAETPRRRFLQLHVGHLTALDHIHILPTAATKRAESFRSLFDMPQVEQKQLAVSESYHTFTVSRYLVWL